MGQKEGYRKSEGREISRRRGKANSVGKEMQGERRCLQQVLVDCPPCNWTWSGSLPWRSASYNWAIVFPGRACQQNGKLKTGGQINVDRLVWVGIKEGSSKRREAPKALRKGKEEIGKENEMLLGVLAATHICLCANIQLCYFSFHINSPVPIVPSPPQLGLKAAGGDF